MTLMLSHRGSHTTKAWKRHYQSVEAPLPKRGSATTKAWYTNNLVENAAKVSRETS